MRRLALALFLACVTTAARADAVSDGRYQAVLGDCEGCHTAPGGAPFAGGTILQTPFGKIAVPNITQDRATGIGKWSQADFTRALRQGMAPGGLQLYPAMPYPAYSKMTDADIAALWAYIKTVRPVRHAVEPDLLPFPFNVRALMAAWNWLNFTPGRFQPIAGKSPAWNRGAYIVTVPGHCGACHSPKTLFGADQPQALTGASLQGWFAPQITSAAPQGVGSWKAAEIVTYLKTGWNNHGVASGPMAEVVEHSTALMKDADLQAVAAYLKDQPGVQVAPSAPDGPAMQAGMKLYQDNCTACHGADGRGQHLVVPPLAGNATLMQPSAESAARIVLEGAQAVSTKDAPTAPAMPSFAWKFSDAEIADLLTYVRNGWGNKGGMVTAEAVAKIRAAARADAR